MPKWNVSIDAAVLRLADARVAEHASDRMLPIERLEGPAVGAGRRHVRAARRVLRPLPPHERRLKSRRTETANEVAMPPPSAPA